MDIYSIYNIYTRNIPCDSIIMIYYAIECIYYTLMDVLCMYVSKRNTSSKMLKTGESE